MSWLLKAFRRKSYECHVEADKWGKRARLARLFGMDQLAHDCDGYAARFHEAGKRWARASDEARMAAQEVIDAQG